MLYYTCKVNQTKKLKKELMIMRKLKKFLCVTLATATLVTSVLSPSGQAQAKDKRYSVKGLVIQMGYFNFIKNNNKYPVKITYSRGKRHRNRVLYIQSGDKLVGVDDEVRNVKSVTKISNKTYSKNYKKMFDVDSSACMHIVHPHQHFTVKEGKDYDKLHAKQIKECGELKKQTEEEYEKVDKEVEELCHKFDDYRRTHNYDYDYENPYYDKRHELVDKRDELEDKIMSLESKYCDLVNSNISPYMYTKDGKRRKTIYSDYAFGCSTNSIHRTKVSDIQLCYKYDKNNSLMPRNKKNFKPFMYVETEALKDDTWMSVEIVAYDKNGKIIDTNTQMMEPAPIVEVGAKGYQRGFKYKYPSNMVSFDVIPCSM